MEQVAVVGLDLAKSVFQVYGVTAQGEAVLRRRLSRGQLQKLFAKLLPCLVGMEAWSPALQRLLNPSTSIQMPQRPFSCSNLLLPSGRLGFSSCSCSL